ncbi:hypothetical protein M595_3765 [Lyngbya aestuarii BL J]|uniref:Uncharacterized protein n=1 Tax=Lyngbya aestuarii BL J TaxID=1348334 RepID=U7QGP8_9CYAN|nr:hypothetical protein M595_3765 [Lyngbya aestuarii BL J]
MKQHPRSKRLFETPANTLYYSFEALMGSLNLGEFPELYDQKKTCSR